MTEIVPHRDRSVTTHSPAVVDLFSDTMKAFTHIVCTFLCFVIGDAYPADSAVDAVEEADAEELLEMALFQDKALGQVDSATDLYRRIIELHRLGRSEPETAERACVRLTWLGRQGSLSANTNDTDLLQERPDLLGVLPRATGLTSRLQLGSTRSQVTGETVRTLAGDPSQPFDARRRWLARVMLVRQSESVVDGSSQQPLLQMMETAIDVFRRMFGLKGLLYYVEQELRRSRPRPLSVHEQLLSALSAEKEYGNFASALGRYRDVVQLSPNGGIATRLKQRARQGMERCARWQRPTPAGS